jgi:hypothetical protein
MRSQLVHVSYSNFSSGLSLEHRYLPKLSALMLNATNHAALSAGNAPVKSHQKNIKLDVCRVL